MSYNKLCDHINLEIVRFNYFQTQFDALQQDFKTRSTKAVYISKDLNRFDNYLYYKEKLIYFYEDYWYDYKGLFLQGDEAAGWHWENKKTLYCKDNLIEVRG